jgi:hypothetical protein
MITSTQQELLKQIEQLLELSPDVRFGQLLDHLGFLAEDREEGSLREVEDERLLGVVEHHRAELERRHQPVG